MLAGEPARVSALAGGGLCTVDEPEELPPEDELLPESPSVVDVGCEPELTPTVSQAETPASNSTDTANAMTPRHIRHLIILFNNNPYCRDSRLHR